MRSLRHRMAGLRSDQSGFSLIELLVASSMALVVAFAAMNFSEVAARGEDRTADRAEALGAARVGLERMTRELRQATSVKVDAATPAVIDLQVHSIQAGATVNVRYDCSQAAECRRYQYPIGGTLPTAYQVVIANVRAATFTVQTYTDSDDYVGVELAVAVPGHAPVSLTDGVHLPNQDGP